MIGWDRRVAVTGAVAKATKRMINRERIYAPRSRDRAEILAAAARVTQTPPRQPAATWPARRVLLARVSVAACPSFSACGMGLSHVLDGDAAVRSPMRLREET